MKTRNILLAVSGGIVLFGLLLAVHHRLSADPVRTVSDPEAESFTVRVGTVASGFEIPTLQDLENTAQEIIRVIPIKRISAPGQDLLTTARVQEVIRTSCGLAAGDEIRIYEPCLFYVRSKQDSFPGTVPEPGWFDIRYGSLPMRQQEEYLVFLVPHQISELYSETETDRKTFRYANPFGSAFPGQNGGVCLSGGSVVHEMTEAERELQQLLAAAESPGRSERIEELSAVVAAEQAARLLKWNSVKGYAFLASSSGEKDRLERLIHEVNEKYYP